MISKEPLRVRITTDHDAMEAIEAVEADGIPRVIERDGHPPLIVSIQKPDAHTRPSEEGIARALAALGGWKDLGGDEDLAETLYRWRHESPERPPVNTE